MRRLGLRCCEALPVIGFAVAPGSEKFVTAQYSYRLLTNFTAPGDINSAFRSLKMPAVIIDGVQDELMLAEKYAEIVHDIAPKIEVKVLPGLNHMDMLHAPAALEAFLAAFRD